MTDGTGELKSELSKLGISSAFEYTGGGCWVLNIALGNGGLIEVSRPDGVEFGYIYAEYEAGMGYLYSKEFGADKGSQDVAIAIKAMLSRRDALTR